MRKRVLGMIMAGGKGTRLFPLTRDRAKPAVPFGGKYRIIDFALSNFMNSEIYSIYVLTQFKSQSLTEHLQRGWGHISLLKNHFIIPVPAQMQTGESWYKGTGDAIFQNLNLIRENHPRFVAVFGGDHIYRMDITQMIDFHEDQGADVTIAGITVPIEEASEFGVMKIDKEGRILNFEEKPANPSPMPNDPTRALVSMGNYVFGEKILTTALTEDADLADSSHDFGNDILPRLLAEGKDLYCYNFETNVIPGAKEKVNTYWRDVGTIDAYYEATLDLRDVVPRFDLFNQFWPIGTAARDLPPSKFVHDDHGRRGEAVQTLVAEGSIISGASVQGSVIGRNVHVHSFAEITDSIIMDNVDIGEGAKLRGVIIDKNVHVPAGEEIGFDIEKDRERFFVSEAGIVVIPKEPG
ncbi:MAG: glucose-1-phosphate adenylyltransferase [Planctomycetota bacterium]|jgi:glucose-1-phosphate adenylyltransferase